MQIIKLYTDFAKYYNELNATVDRKKETKFIKWAIKKHGKSNGDGLLDVACGTGLYLPFFKKDFEIVAIDASKDMLSVAKRNVKGVKFVLGKMQSFRISKKFDAILCRGAMDYNFNHAELGRTLANFYRHLKSGGVVIFTFEAVKDNFKEGNLNVRTASYKNTKLVEAAIRHAVPGKTFYNRDVVYLLYTGRKLRIIKDSGKEALFSVSEVEKILSNTGFKTYTYYDFTNQSWNKSAKEKKAIFVGVK